MRAVIWILTLTCMCGLALTACVGTPTPTLLPSEPAASSSPKPISPSSTQIPNQQSTVMEETESDRQPASFLSESVPAEAWETKRILESLQYPARDLIELTERFGGPGLSIPEVVRDGSWGFETGDRHSFWVENNNRGNKYQVTARLVYKTPHAYFFVDEGLELNEDELKPLADRFDEATYPRNRDFFGQEWSPGVDNDPRLIVLLTKDLDTHYQNSRDEYSRLVNEYSNEMEMIYISTEGERVDELDCTLAHEFAHLIQWAVDKSEETWLLEGISELACPLNGQSAWYSEMIAEAFAREPDTQLNTWADDMDQAAVQYGASYVFMVYLLDRFGEDTMHALVTDPKHGVKSVDAVLGSMEDASGFDDVFADWVVANLVNDPQIEDGRYCYSSIAPPMMNAGNVYKIEDLPVERMTSVAQYAADYFVLEGGGNFQVEFAGERAVGLAPTSLGSGDHAWWSGRGTNSDTTLTREFDLRGLETATLSFATWYDIVDGFDYGYVAVSTDGKHWTTLPGTTTTEENTHGVNFGQGYTGGSGGWIEEEIDLTPYAGEVVQIRFQYLTDDGPLHAGWFVDDITIPELTYQGDFEAGGGGWIGDGFSRIVPLLPQEWLVQLVRFGQDDTTVEPLPLKENNSGSWLINLGDGEKAILVISGLTRGTAERGEYWYGIARIGTGR